MSQPYTLLHPLTLDAKGAALVGLQQDDRITEVTLRRATGQDLKLIDRFRDKPIELTLNMIARLSGVDLYVIEKFDAEDIGPLGDLAMASSPNGQSTGGTA